MIILDTNVISEVMKPAPQTQVLDWLNRQNQECLAVTAITAAEIYYGIGRLPQGKRKADLATQFRRFLQQGFEDRLLPFDALGMTTNL
ncbi:MAG: PIN domain-containing protein [Thermosynechococcaceae cyanobacterium]